MNTIYKHALVACNVYLILACTLPCATSAATAAVHASRFARATLLTLARIFTRTENFRFLTFLILIKLYAYLLRYVLYLLFALCVAIGAAAVPTVPFACRIFYAGSPSNLRKI